jgi:uncharacterized protein YneF (UPF0154 family)
MCEKGTMSNTILPVFIMTLGGIALGLGVGIIIGYFLGRRIQSREQQKGFPVVPGKVD